MLENVSNNVSEIMTSLNNLVLKCRFSYHNSRFYSVYMIREMYMFFAKIWFVKTSTRLVKYKSRVVKSNPPNVIISRSVVKYEL